jgi:hypothetical protein
MPKIFPGRFTADIHEPFVVFLIGLRINRLWAFHKWMPVAKSMPQMLELLAKNPAKGLLGLHTWVGWRDVNDRAVLAVVRRPGEFRAQSRRAAPASLEGFQPSHRLGWQRRRLARNIPGQRPAVSVCVWEHTIVRIGGCDQSGRGSRQSRDRTPSHGRDERVSCPVSAPASGIEYLALLFGNSDDDPLFLQIKECVSPAHAPYVPLLPERYREHEGKRVVVGQRALQASSDIMLGITKIDGRPYFVRQMKNMKASIPVEWLTGESFNFYAWACGTLLARAHARAGDAAAIAGYCGGTRVLDKALATWAEAYGDQTERDHEQLVKAIKSGKVKAIMGV